MKKILLSIFALTLLASCTKEIEFNGEQTDSKLVINSLMEPGQPIRANVSKSYFFLDAPDTAAPDDIKATLYVNGNDMGEMTLEYDTVTDYNGWYLPEEGYYRLVKVFTHPYCPVQGDVVKMTASAEGFDDVEATASPLPGVADWSIEDCQVTEWEITYYAPYDSFEEDTMWYVSGKLEMILNISDPNPGKTDYYKIYVGVGGVPDEETGSVVYTSTSYNDPVFGGTSLGDIDVPLGPEGVFTDMLFDGGSYKIKLPIELSISFWNGAYQNTIQVPVRMEHFTKEYYNYLLTRSQDDEILQFFAEPVQTYSNVEGGYGVVAGRAVDTLKFDLPSQK